MKFSQHWSALISSVCIEFKSGLTTFAAHAHGSVLVFVVFADCCLLLLLRLLFLMLFLPLCLWLINFSSSYPSLSWSIGRLDDCFSAFFCCCGLSTLYYTDVLSIWLLLIWLFSVIDVNLTACRAFQAFNAFPLARPWIVSSLSTVDCPFIDCPLSTVACCLVNVYCS